MRKNGNINLLLFSMERSEHQGMQRTHFVGRCACRGALKVERSYFCQQSPVSSTGSSGAPTSSPLLLDVESAVCTAQHSARDKLPGRRVGKQNGINKRFIKGMACLSTNSLLQACAQKATKPPELLLGFPLCKHIAAGSCHRHWGPARERVAETACSCVPSSSAHSRAVTSSTCRERGGRWEMG